MSDPVPAITEADAAGEVAEIFADIRHVLGVGVVNLIWRHVATIPGALPWLWETLRPLYVDGTIAGEATSLRAALELPNVPPFPPEVFAAAGLSDGDLASIRDVLAAYDRTNAMALIALSAALHRLDGAPALDSHENVPAERPSVLPLPPLLDLTDMTAATADLVSTLNRLGTRRKDPVLALAAISRARLDDDRACGCRRTARPCHRRRQGPNAGRSDRRPHLRAVCGAAGTGSAYCGPRKS